MKVVLCLIYFLSLFLLTPNVWAFSNCLDTHVRLVTPEGRMPLRNKVPINLRKKGTKGNEGKLTTDLDGNACIPYDNSMTGGEELEIYIGRSNESGYLPWSQWSVISPYNGVIYLPKLNKQHTPIEVVIVPRYLKEVLMGYRTEKIDKYDCPKGQNRHFLQIIAVNNKVRAELILSSLHPKYSGCRQEVMRSGVSLYRVLIEKPRDINLPVMCSDITKTYLPRTKFKCESKPLKLLVPQV